jgi:1-acylglycerone phosphate reductase
LRALDEYNFIKQNLIGPGMSRPKTILITGCSDGGIGSALAKEFQNKGHRVLAGVRNINKAESIANLPNITVIILDVTSEESISQAVKFVKDETRDNGLDILVNNAGHGGPSPLVDANLDDGRKMFEVNFWGLLAMVQAFTPLLVKAQGTIVNISSVSSKFYTPYLGVYSCSKAAVTMASDTLRLEMRPLGVNVVNAIVGMVDTNFGYNLEDVTLAKDSLYKSVESFVNNTPGGHGDNMQKHKMNLDTFAKRLVSDVLAGKKGHLWRGGMSTTSRLVGWLSPRWLLVSISVIHLFNVVV